jgi:hypothetical protein
MHPQALIQQLDKEPFVPFRVHLSDGRTLEVFNPGLTYVTGTTFYVLHPADRNNERTRHMSEARLIALRHIVSIEPIEANAA